MPANISWNGFGRVSAVDTLTGVTALKISGTGGGPSAALADGQIQGNGAATCVVSRQRVALYYDIGAGNELDFSSGGTEENQILYIWGQFLAPALLQTRENGGFGVFLASSAPSTTNYHLYYFFGSNTLDVYNGGPYRFAIDPTSTVSSSSGTLNLASVRYFGVFADVGANIARFDNLILDAIDVGYGLNITGTSTSDKLISDLLDNENTNKYGIVRSLNLSSTAVELAGQLIYGDNQNTASTDLSDIDSKIFLDEPKYYDGTSVTNSIPTNFYKINFVGNTTGDSIFQFGKKVGTGDTARGRNGISIIGNETYSLSIDFDDGNVNQCKIYGCSFENITGTITWGTNVLHENIGNSFTQCSQFDPVGAVITRNCNFTSYSGANAAILWNANIDIKNCNFISNTDLTNNPAAIEHPDAGTFSYDNLIFSGNDHDIFFSNTTGNLIINAINGSNPQITGNINLSSGTITVNNNKSLKFTGIPVGLEGRVKKGLETLYHVQNILSGEFEYLYSPPSQIFDVQVTIGGVDNDGIAYERISRKFSLINQDRNIPLEFEPLNSYI